MHTRWKISAVGGLLVWALASAGGCNPTAPDPGPVGNGKLRLLVTDRPFPVDLVEKATVTITRVEVRRSNECEDGCDDDLFCNGAESCTGGVCTAGAAPCDEGQTCDEASDACLTPCTADTDCDDLAYCNGVEVCVDDFCAAGSVACAEDFDCDEATQQCVAETDEDGETNDSDDADDDDGENDDDDGGSPWVVVFDGERVFNLLDLRNGRTDLLADVEIPAGTYTQMRLIVTEGEVTLIDGRAFPLRVPSGAQTGIKLHFEFEVSEAEETQLLLDVDLSRAFRPIPAGHIDDPSTIRSFHFSPSVAMRLINLLEAGSISGVVTATVDGAASPLAGVSVTAFDGDTEVTATTTEADGTYVLGGLPTGDYRVVFSAAGYDDVELADVAVAAGSATEHVDATMTVAAADAMADGG